jgi:SPRY domain/Silencing defective 2 N-terminal ubiquitin domain/Replication stress response SDE2 C-terminal
MMVTTESALNARGFEDASRCRCQQLLVRFQEKTYVLAVPAGDDTTRLRLTLGAAVQLHKGGLGGDGSLRAVLLDRLADETGWPASRLQVTHFNHPFVRVSVRSCIRGGKGGFGTLLKGQSRQAGAKLTTDFGACRDLQGRRLRHVNDEIKLRKFRDRQRREAAGLKVDDDDLWRTPSGIYNWHLMTPTWADVSKKAAHQIKRQFQQMDREDQRKAALRKEQEEVYQNTMTHYLNETTAISESVQQELNDALKQGLSNQRKRKKEAAASATPVSFAATESDQDDVAFSDNDQPSSLVSLSGEVIVEARKESAQLQSKSEFMTAVFVLDLRGSTSEILPSGLYYEVTLVTGGLAQIGWASLAGHEHSATSQGFAPSNDLGDGVGDDSYSYAVDGSRGLKFHAGDEWECPIQWKDGDRLGCFWDCISGKIAFTVNGEDMGTTFSTDFRSLVPAFSCNQGEILELHTSRDACKYFPKGENVVAINDLVDEVPVKEVSSDKTRCAVPQLKDLPDERRKTEPESTQRKEQWAPTDQGPQSKRPSKPPEAPETLNLDEYGSAQELEMLGLDRLKSALMALQVKCG